MSSLYARYVKEKYGQETIEEEYGFITYILSDTVCRVETLYVTPEARRSGIGTSLGNRLVEELPKTIKYLVCEIDTSALHGLESFAAIASFGFEILNTNGSLITMVKYL